MSGCCAGPGADTGFFSATRGRHALSCPQVQRWLLDDASVSANAALAAGRLSIAGAICRAAATGPIEHFETWETFGHACTLVNAHSASHHCACGYEWGA